MDALGMATPGRDGRRLPLGGDQHVVVPLAARSAQRIRIFGLYSFEQGAEIIACVRCGDLVLVQVDHLEPDPGQRLIDYVCGGVTALDGQSHRLDEGVFLFAPAAIPITTI